jgi:urease accessory protein
MSARLIKDAPPLAHDRVVMDYDQRLMRRKLLTSAGGREFLVDLPSVTNLDDYWGFDVSGIHVKIVAAETGTRPARSWPTG